MKKIKAILVLIIVFSISITSCEQDTIVEESSVQNTDLRVSDIFGCPNCHWALDFPSYWGCLNGFAFCKSSPDPYNPNLFPIAPNGEFGGVPINVRLVGQNLHFQILEEFASLELVKRKLQELDGDPSEAQSLYQLIKNTVLIEDIRTLGPEVSYILTNTENFEIFMNPGTYTIDYSNSEFGEFTIPISQVEN